MEKKYTHHKAQTMCLESFGPFPVVAAFHLSPYYIACKFEAVYAINNH